MRHSQKKWEEGKIGYILLWLYLSFEAPLRRSFTKLGYLLTSQRSRTAIYAQHAEFTALPTIHCNSHNVLRQHDV